MSYTTASLNPNATSNLSDPTMIMYAQKVNIFKSYFQRMVYLRAGQDSNINIDDIKVVYRNTMADAQVDNYLLMRYPAQKNFDNEKVPADCSTDESNTICKIFANLKNNPDKIYSFTYKQKW